MEYVCDLADDYPDIGFGDDEYSGTVERRERVVRCRDCGQALDGATCGGIWCMEHSRQTEPDGFCSWGSERDGE